jgi:hypothetical protein
MSAHVSCTLLHSRRFCLATAMPTTRLQTTCTPFLVRICSNSCLKRSLPCSDGDLHSRRVFQDLSSSSAVRPWRLSMWTAIAHLHKRAALSNLQCPAHQTLKFQLSSCRARLLSPGTIPSFCRRSVVTRPTQLASLLAISQPKPGSKGAIFAVSITAVLLVCASC